MPIRKSSVSSAGVPSGTTADRPTDPSIGDTFYNGTLGVQEIYTSSGWLPATGANDFNIVLTGSETSVTLDKEYFSGAYTITSALSDTSFDIYLFDTQGNSAGYTKSPSVNATANFNKIVVLGGQDGDLLSFAYKTTFTTTAATDEVTTGPIIKSISVTDLPNIEDTTVITGVNFAENVEVTFTGTNDVALSAKSVVRSSATSLIVTRPDTLIEDHSPYTITITNPGVTPPTGTNGHIAINSITAGGDPTWSTPEGNLPFYEKDQPYSTSLSATDPDAGSITYSIVSGALPTGLSLNSSTGEISGTPTQSTVSSIIVAATDSGNNVTNRSFTVLPSFSASGGNVTDINIGGQDYRVHSFTSSGSSTFSVIGATDSLDVLVVAGGGGGGCGSAGSSLGAGGGGAGGVVLGSGLSVSEQDYSINVGSGGSGAVAGSDNKGSNGLNSTAFGLVAIGGGGGGSRNSGVDKINQIGSDGGSGGGTTGAQGADANIGPGSALQPSSASGGFGNSGGAIGTAEWSATGGGGANAEGGASVENRESTDGGAGRDYSAFFGTSFGEGGYFAGGGGGGEHNSTAAGVTLGQGQGGIGGGGDGGDHPNLGNGQNGLANTGGGGGGGCSLTQSSSTDFGGGSGGSGTVIIRYPI